MMDGMFAFATPVEELEADLGTVPVCDECKSLIQNEAHYDGGDNYYCEAYLTKVVERLEPDAPAFAEENCRITRRLPRYNSKLEYRCTPEDYEFGNRDSYTPNAYACSLRHAYTNYDELIKELSRDCLRDRVWYVAIRERIDSMLEDALDDDAFMEEDEDVLE